MKLMISGCWERTTLDDVGSRFASGEHTVPPEPCTLITRWHDPSAKRFWLAVDTPDARVIQDWMARWIDIIDWEVNIALDDEEVGELLGNVLAARHDFQRKGPASARPPGRSLTG